MIQRFKFFIYAIVLFLAKRRTVARTNRILIVKTDEIGDYMLWRNLAPLYRAAARFRGYSLVLCGNKAWKKIADNFDKDIFDEYIWIDKKKFKSDMKYRYRFLKDINNGGFSQVVNAIFSRSLRPDDSIVAAAKAPLNIGMISNAHNIYPYEKGYDKGLYQELIDTGSENIFEFSRNKLFLEKLTGQSQEVHFGIDKQLLQKPSSLPAKYFIIFPGSNKADRIWSTANFVAVASFIHENYHLTPVVCGGPGDQPYVQSFMEAFPHAVIRFEEKEGLKDFINALAFAQCIISVDTGAVHLAAAVHCPVYGIFNGSYYKRFAPYPPAVFNKFYAIYPDRVDEDLKAPGSVSEKYQGLSPAGYNEVSASKVIELIQHTFAYRIV